MKAYVHARVFRLNTNQSIDDNGINGVSTALIAERALAELRQGRALYLRRERGRQGEGDLVIAAAETVGVPMLERMANLAPASAPLRLALTWRRAAALGLAGNVGESVEIELRGTPRAEHVAALAGVGTTQMPGAQVPAALREIAGVRGCAAVAAAALDLAKRARLLPAILTLDAAHVPAQATGQLLEIAVDDVREFDEPTGVHLERISEARVPLAGHEDCRLRLFRDTRDGAEHVAVVIGNPDVLDAVPVRLHSACLTGDLLGSLRCDCGDQLRQGVESLAAAGGGVLLYLAQEGRGIGLANKLRAYELQDAGLDTLEADRHLGFRADERSYAAATAMLRDLGFTRIRLLTNNPAKMHALEAGGIEVVAGERVLAPVNRHNARYLRAKRDHAGHLVPEPLA